MVIFQRVSITISQLSGLLRIGCRINDQRSDGGQGVTLGLKHWGGAAHLTHTKGKHLGNNQQ